MPKHVKRAILEGNLLTKLTDGDGVHFFLTSPLLLSISSFCAQSKAGQEGALESETSILIFQMKNLRPREVSEVTLLVSETR